MKKWLSEFPTPEARRVFFTALSLLVFSVLANIYPVITSLQSAQWEAIDRLILIGLVSWAVYMVVCVAGMVLSQRGQHRLAGWLILIGLVANIAIIDFFVAGVGALIGLSILTFAIGLAAILQFSQRDFTWAAILGLILMFFVILYDQLENSRPSAPHELTSYIPVVAGIQFIVLAALTIRNYPEIRLKIRHMPSLTRSAFWLLAFFAASSIPMLVTILQQSFEAPAWQMQWATGLTGGAVAFVFIGIAFVLNDQPERGIWIALLPWFALLVMISGLVAGLGLVFLLSASVLASWISIQLMPYERKLTFFAVGLTAGILALLVDTFIPLERVTLPGVQWVAYVLIALLLLSLTFIIGRQYRNFSLQAKLVIAFLAVTMLPLGVGLLLNNWSTQRYLTQAAEANLRGAAVETAAVLDTFISNNLENARVAAQLLDFVEYLNLPAYERPNSETKKHVNNNLRSLASRDPYITSIGLMTLDGENIADTDPTQLGEVETGKRFFVETLMVQKPTVSSVELDEGDLSMYFSAPVFDENDKMIGVLRIRYDAAVLQELLVESASNAGVAGGVADLLDEYHIFLAITDEPDEVLKTVVALPPERLIKLQQQGRLPEGTAENFSLDQPDMEEGLNNGLQQPNFELASEAEHASVAYLKNKSWAVVFAQPQATYLAPLAGQTKSAVVLGLTVMVIAVVLGLSVVRVIVQPVTELTQAAQDFTAGNLNRQVAVNTNDELGTLGRAFNSMAAQLHESIHSLEQRVADRTRALAASAEVSRRLSAVLDQSELMQLVVDQLQSELGYYHVHVYLFDRERKNMLMVAGSGEVGKKMLEKKHFLRLERGLVGKAARLNTTVLVPDVTQEPAWAPNPLLPETRSEVAVPIALKDEVLGVIDAQQSTVNGLSQADADLLASIAQQVAVTLQNVRLFAQTQSHAKRQMQLDSISLELQRAKNVDEALKIAVREVGKALNTRSTRVVLKSEGQQ